MVWSTIGSWSVMAGVEILNTWDKLMDVSWLGMHSPSVEAFSSLDISASQFVKYFLSQKQFAQYDNDNANWMGMIPSNHFPLPYVFFFRFCLELWQLVFLLPCETFRNRKRAQPKALGQRTMATGHPIACLITVSRRTPDLQKRSALAIDGVSRWVALV